MTSPVTKKTEEELTTEAKPVGRTRSGRYSIGLSPSTKRILITGVCLVCLAGTAAAEKMCYSKQDTGKHAWGDNGDEKCWADFYKRHDCPKYQQAAVIVGKSNDTTAKVIMNALAESFCGPNRALPVENSGNDLSPSNYLAMLVAFAAARFFN